MPDQPPSIGRIVTYRTRASVDIPAIITALVDDGPAAHVTQFPPPGVGADHLSYEWGADYSAEPADGCWRWPERVELAKAKGGERA
jgi:hypothetical protein